MTASVPRVDVARRILLPLLVMATVVWALPCSTIRGEEKPAAETKLFDGKTLDGWKSAEFGGEGEVTVANGEITLEMGNEMTGITSTRKDLPKTDYEIELEAKRVAGHDFFCALTFQVGDSPCSFVVGGWGGGTVGLSSIDRMDASENSTTSYQSFKDDQWYKVRVRVTPKKISAWIDKDQVVDFEIKGHKLSIRPEVDLCQPLGIATWNTKAVVRNIKLRKLAPEAEKMKIRLGMIGLDTSHVIAFTKAVKAADAPAEVQRLDIVAGFPGGSPDVPESATRVEGYTKQLREMGVEIVDSVDALLGKVDAVLLESVDGRPHLEFAKQVIKARKPLFIDKPVAGSLADTLEIYRLAKEAGVPCFSSSSTRFSPGIAGLRNNEEIGDIVGCDAYGPCKLESHHPDLYWYGIHGVEIVYTLMGPGCVSVTRSSTPEVDQVTGVWADGRIGTYRGLRTGKNDLGAMVFGSKKIVPTGPYAGYVPLLSAISKFFDTGKPPVSAEETIELYTFMEAADESKRQGGKPVELKAVLEKASKR